MDTPSSYAARSPSIVSPFLTYVSRTNGNNYVFVALFALLALLAVFFVVRGWGRFRPNVPFALEDELPSRKERVQQYVRNSREVLAKGYSKFTLERYTKVGALPAWSIKLFSAKFNPALDSYAEIFQNMVGEHIANLLPPAHGKGLTEQYSNGAKVVLRQMKNKKANGLKPLSDPPSVFDYVNDDASKLEKMDSFIKEVQRFCSPDLTTFQRKATGPVTLSNGFHLPKGARIEVATGAINADTALYDNPSEFDGLRFYKKRQTEEARSKYQVLSVSKEYLAWGYGRAACPGRFLADMLIKMILVEVLKRYDIKMPDGQSRYENMEVQGQTLPNEEGEILIRERDVNE
ncbi:Cytochrome P450 monooxygenase BOA4 [Colletotrichum sp. SAR 10_98]|nr:Cytochrome P450 monooxygenase BOA4 [Colletotrichum sp. SAR 10_98]